MNTQSTRLEKSLECHKHTESSLRMRRKKVYCEAATMDIAHANTISCSRSSPRTISAWIATTRR